MQDGAGETGGTGGKPTQLEAVWRVMSDRDWHTLAEIAERASCPQASASARLRDLRKSQFGGRSIERHYVERGQFRYRVVDAPASVGGDQV